MRIVKATRERWFILISFLGNKFYSLLPFRRIVLFLAPLTLLLRKIHYNGKVS